ncbi:MAG: DEAD/DEAH box helicase, partial [Gammaproteobacteria bacterium]
MPTDSESANPTFSDLALSGAVLKAIAETGYETPTPIQLGAIPTLLEGRDLLGTAQTGSGKTAAFALPVLSRISGPCKNPTVLCLAPTRELAIQVAEAFQSYARHIKGFHVAPLYGGADYRQQIRLLKNGVNVVVGTPGRIMDHIRRGTLCLDDITTLILDEADEMLRMGFIDDVEWILEQMPESLQTALFSATMPPRIRRITQKYLHNPVEVTIKQKTTTAASIRQRYLIVNHREKLDTLTRLLEVEDFDGLIIFVRTRNATQEISERLQARGHAAQALNGDIPQAQREKTVNRFKQGSLDIIIATDVAARGLDVERITHVVNYDAPYDTESYVHRIGRTGRAGR